MREAPFYKDRALMNIIYLYYNIFIVSTVLIFAIGFYDDNKLLKQI